MKMIKLFVIHPQCYNVSSALDYLCLNALSTEFNFVWDSKCPDYLIATEHIYKDIESRRLFNHLYGKSKIRIFHGGEAVSPDFNLFDYAVGYDADLMKGDRFSLLPPPYIFPGKGFVDETHNSIVTDEQARVELSKKTGFCNFLYSNPHANPIRDRIFYILSAYKKVDSLGCHLNNVGKNGTGFIGHSLECVPLKSKYKFSIACENTNYVGYASEKIFTSFNAHTVPIYWGDPIIEEIVNPKSFINANKYNSLEELVEEVKRIDQSEEEWCSMIKEPWMTLEQENTARKREKNYELFFSEIFSRNINESKRLSVGTFPEVYSDIYTKGYYTIKRRIKRKINKIFKLKK